MAQGGARYRSGPPPDPAALRRDRATDAAWTTLPTAGRQGDPPTWPLGRTNAREAHWWRVLWAKPQAVEWERLGMEAEVALYVRRFCEAEKRDSAVSLSTLVKQLGEQLGLTIPGMRMHRWRIGETAAAAKAVRTRPSTGPSSVRDRFRVIDGDGESA